MEAERMCVFGPSRKAEVLSWTRWYKNCHNISSLQFFNFNFGRMLCNSYSNRFGDFCIFPFVAIGAIDFQSKKNRQCSLVFWCFSLQKKWKNFVCFDFNKLHNMTNIFVKNLCFYRARFSIQSLLKTTPCHSSTSAKKIPAFYQTAATNIPCTGGQLPVVWKLAQPQNAGTRYICGRRTIYSYFTSNANHLAPGHMFWSVKCEHFVQVSSKQKHIFITLADLWCGHEII